ncbi:hypothetical protein IPM65_02360 [Candidatus Roizmanbacteria bacterium]|nr:MAG: hypothetical protein IPM65_02360 [Candidatus Roizmanbacteria bacterium]
MKLLKYIIILLFVVVLAEAFYLFVIKGFQFGPKKQNTAQTAITRSPTATPSEPSEIEIDENRLESIDQFYYDINPNMALDPKVIYSHIFYKKRCYPEIGHTKYSSGKDLSNRSYPTQSFLRVL